jgi:hypothetical protein
MQRHNDRRSAVTRGFSLNATLGVTIAGCVGRTLGRDRLTHESRQGSARRMVMHFQTKLPSCSSLIITTPCGRRER